MAFYGYCGPAAILFVLKTTVSRLRKNVVGLRNQEAKNKKLHELVKRNKLYKLVLNLPTINKLADELSTSTKLGTHHEDMVKYLKRVGFKVRVREEAEWKHIKNALDEDRQVLIDWWTDFGDPGQDLGHYSVALRCGKRFLTIYDPDINKKRRIGKDRFMQRWHDVAADGRQLNQWMAEIKF